MSTGTFKRQAMTLKRQAIFLLTLFLLTLVGLFISGIFATDPEALATTNSIVSTADTSIGENAPNKNYGSTTTIGVDGDVPTGSGKDKSALIKWNLSGISPGTKVNSASVALTVSNSSTETYQVYKLNRPWVESKATWTNYDTSKPWQVAGANGALDRDATPVGTIAPKATGKQTFTLTPDVVQGWVDNPASNQGIIIAHTTNTDGFEFYSRESTTSSQRPTLTLDLGTADSIPPTVSNVTPADGATSVSLTDNVEATFSEDMDPTTLTSNTFTLTKQDSATPVTTAVNYNSATKKATLNPDMSLETNTTYTATVKGGSGGAKDAAGNALAQDKVWSFTTTASSLDSGSVALGVFPGNQNGNPAWACTTNCNELTYRALQDFEDLTGKSTELVLLFHRMESGGSCMTTPSDTNTMYVGRGYVPVVSWEPTSAANPQAIANGSWDSCLIAEANKLKGFGGTIVLRPMHEMNGNWVPWGLQAYSPAQQIAAWQHMHDVFQAQGATNVKWLWNPNVRCPTYCDNVSFSTIYPGNSYVDILGLDGYNWGSVHNDSWRSFDNIYKPSYTEITALADKPVWVVEYASHEQSGQDKGQWITDTRNVVKSGSYPKIQAMLWFHSNQDGALWRVDTSSSAVDAYKAFVQDPYYQVTLP